MICQTEYRGKLTKIPKSLIWFNERKFNFIDELTGKEVQVNGYYLRHKELSIGNEVSADKKYCAVLNPKQ